MKKYTLTQDYLDAILALTVSLPISELQKVQRIQQLLKDGLKEIEPKLPEDMDESETEDGDDD